MKKLFIIRHVRYFYLRYKLNSYIIDGGYACASESDIKFLHDVWQGNK